MASPIDYLGMSDEELSKINPASVEEAALEAEDDVPAAEGVTEVADAPVDADLDADDADDQADTDDSKDDSGDADDVGEGEAVTDEDADTDKPEVVDAPAAAEKVDDVPVADAPAIDYKAEYERLLKPFKANGKDIAVTSVDEATSLMQMGANYNKKMAGLKPNLRLMQLLESNGLLSEEKLSYLIDLDKKSPEAISKLIKDSGLDPLDLDAAKASEYKPKTYAVDERAMELDTVLDDLQHTPTYNRTLDIVSNKWDGPSKQTIADSPQLLKVINNHVERGIYDKIMVEVERERLFGRLSGLSDIQAYRQVGDAIEARGGFAPVGNPVTPKPVVVVPPKPKVEDDKLRDKRRAAGSTKPAGASPVSKDFNPLSLSDEEFSKQVNPNFL